MFAAVRRRKGCRFLTSQLSVVKEEVSYGGSLRTIVPFGNS